MLADSETDAALNIDPILQTVGHDPQRLGELGLELRYVIETPGISTTSPMPAIAPRPTRALRWWTVQQGAVTAPAILGATEKIASGME